MVVPFFYPTVSRRNYSSREMNWNDIFLMTNLRKNISMNIRRLKNMSRNRKRHFLQFLSARQATAHKYLISIIPCDNPRERRRAKNSTEIILCTLARVLLLVWPQNAISRALQQWANFFAAIRTDPGLRSADQSWHEYLVVLLVRFFWSKHGERRPGGINEGGYYRRWINMMIDRAIVNIGLHLLLHTDMHEQHAKLRPQRSSTYLKMRTKNIKFFSHDIQFP